jgi:RimJ/RimL family protein N-acetyltransferase
LNGIPEIGWVLSPDVHGRGLATEAVQAALSWMDGQGCGETTTCIIHRDNAASMRVAGKAGYREHAR